MNQTDLLKITVFHCINALEDVGDLPTTDEHAGLLNAVKLPCSSMTRDIFLLRAFESGADAVMVLVCPDEGCRHVEGSIRARKRVEHVKKMLKAIDLDDDRLQIYAIAPGDTAAAAERLSDLQGKLSRMGPLFPR